MTNQNSTQNSTKSQRQRLKLNLRLKLGIAILAFFAIAKLEAIFFTTVDPSQQGTYLKNMPFSGAHPLGTNSQGQDIFWFLVFAVRNSLALGIAVSLCVTVIATLVGLSAGYLGGWFEQIVMLIIYLFITIPVLPILIVLGALVRGRTSFVMVGELLVIFWLGLGRAARCARWRFRSREREFVNMARFFRCSNLRHHHA